MVDQLSLFDGDQERFESWKKFHTENMHVFEEFRHFALMAWSRGKSVGARLIIERIRWEAQLTTENEDGYKISNNHIPYWARLLAGLDFRFAEYFVFKDERFDATVAEIVAFHKQLKGHHDT